MLDVFLKYTELDTPILFSEENLSGGLWLEVQKPPIRGIHMKLEVKRRKPCASLTSVRDRAGNCF